MTEFTKYDKRLYRGYKELAEYLSCCDISLRKRDIQNLSKDILRFIRTNFEKQK
jgi:hypothetical protein